MEQNLFTGPTPFSMTNDFLFKYLLQENEDTLKAIICAFLDVNENEIKSVKVENPILLTDDVRSKEMILDVKVNMNDDTIINLEMQVINHQDWPERSLSYLCRCFDNLQKGQGYRSVKNVIHLGFLNYSLFPNEPEFYSTYRLYNEKTHKLYSSKFRISVVDLKHIELATDEDKFHKRNLWSKLFKSKTWEELDMLASQDEQIKKTVFSVKKLSEEERFRLQCEAREDRIRQEIDMIEYYTDIIKEKDNIIKEQGNTIKEQGNTIKEQGNTIKEQGNQIKEQEERLTALENAITELKNNLK